MLKVHILGKFLLIFSIAWAICFETFVSNIYQSLREICATSEQLNYFKRVVFFRITRRSFLGGHVIARPGVKQQAAN